MRRDLELFTELAVQEMDVSSRPARGWAARWKQNAAYEASFLAAAEQLRAEYWTADQALVTNARKFGADWIHWMGEIR